MASLVVEGKMLYCPKCQQTYQEGSQRFCNNDGGRLLPVSNADHSRGKGGGVFTNLLSRNAPDQERDEKLASIPRFVRAESEPAIFPANPSSRIFESDADEIELELDVPRARSDETGPDAGSKTAPFPEIPLFVTHEPAIEPPPNREPRTAAQTGLESELLVDEAISETAPGVEELLLARPMGRTVRPDEIPSGRAELGDRQVNPAGRDALTWDNTDVMVGQTVKGRYRILEQVGEDESGISYLAEDKIIPNKKVLVRILMDEEEADDFTSKIYAEERISFSHINHPNVVGVIDSGELQEGKSFLITEYVEGDSINDVLEKTGQFNVSRTARIIRQASYALSEMHQNGVLHRNLKPGNVILTYPEGGTEQVKITGFCISGARTAEADLVYRAPEVLEGQVATYASDVFSLAVIAYEMLTHRLPFTGLSARQMLRSQRDGMVLRPTNLRLDVPALADSILEKAMAPDAVERYPKARDFGDALFNALTTVSPWTDGTADDVEVISTVEGEAESIPPPPAPIFLDPEDEDAGPAETTEAAEPIAPDAPAALTEDPAWTKRSPEPPKPSGPNWVLLTLLGLALLAGIGALVVFLNRPSQPVYVAPLETVDQSASGQPPIGEKTDGDDLSAVDRGEVPPPPRPIKSLPDSVFFQNAKPNLKGDLARNFVAFSLYYPKDWKVNEAKESSEPGTRGKFLDISHDAPNGKLAEQMLISYYESRGTIDSDAEKFPQAVAETNETLKKLIPNYQMLSQGRTTINGWQAYEVKFQGGGTTDKGEKLILWGRRVFVPAARPGVKYGFEITMLATSYSESVKSVDDVGNRGGLATVIFTFEPGRNF